MKHLELKLVALVVLVFIFTSWVSNRVQGFYVPTTIDDFFMPGSQPLQSGTFASPNMCDNCHGNYDTNAEPAFTWRGSMMAHSMRDPLFEASLTISNQDAAFSGDLCIRCHSPGGWLEGRSTPTDGSALTTNDRQGVQCHVCHKMVDPMSSIANDVTYMENLTNVPSVHGNGMYVIDSEDIRRGPYENVQSNHATMYSEFHTSSNMCATCHDVSNPVYSKQPDGTYLPNTLGLPSSNFDTYEMFPVERTFSEWKMSAYNSETGVVSDAFGGNLESVISCQDCHMKEVTGKGSNKSFSPIRNDLGQHDLTGGNTFVPLLIKDLYSNDSNVDQSALDDGILRAQYMLQHAATMDLQAIMDDDLEIEVKITNETGHKLPSGYPEGRRMWIHLVAYDTNNNVLFESGSYDSETAVLDLENTKIYEAKLGISEEVAEIANANSTTSYTYNPGESFHFALNNLIVKDNRIPPRGFTNANFEAIQAAPVGYSYEDGSYWDITYFEIPENTYKVVVQLFYQTVSKEYIDFLLNFNETNSKGQELYDLWVAHGKSAPELMAEEELILDFLNLPDSSEPKELISIFPNPASNEVHLKFHSNEIQNLNISIFTSNGTLVQEFNNKENFNYVDNSITLKLDYISKGTYIMRIRLNDSIITKFLVVK
ncbi:T9SS type A sorting domain-containing protein [Mangrovimonas futianensis]|uniref:T9SS type A sorting domain-containing protein n=1 Tax=Mangrovimonas futianensis TaxID=2895523 RepID=UPI001E659806|nr:T9SS type A sorting domain-containing protein [Mangrovimonas futianensis]MCF1422020.1 T9SS type A sorting domain-containing protein [Mangrovimonas futianensis]